MPAAKLHMLQLEPIKAKLGAKWEKLSALVHTLFEICAGRKARATISFWSTK